MERLISSLIMGLILLLSLAPRYVDGSDSCPKGVKELNRQGGDDEISWQSLAILSRIDDKDWCYYRRVVLRKPERQYVNWPKGEIHGKVVEGKITTSACCYPEPRAEDGELEHGYSGKRMPTQVYRGFKEPQQNQTWISISGAVYLEPKTVRIDLTLRSGFRKTSQGYDYLYEIANRADKVVAVWNSVDSEFFKKNILEYDLTFPLKLKAEGGWLKFSGYSKNLPGFRAKELFVLSEDGKEVFRMLAPAYIPK